MIKNVHLRPNNKANNASKTRPNSYRNSINSPRNSKLLSRNSVEVLSYNDPQKCVESVCNSSESGQTRKFYGQIASQRDNKTGNSRIAKQADVALTRKVGSRIPGPSTGLSKIASCKFSTSSSSSSSSSYSSSSTVLHASSTSPSSSGSDAGSPDSGELMPMIDGTKKPVLRSVENEPRPSPKTTFLKTEAEKVLTEQLLLGKIPPKAKFRADDEISIGDPAESNEPVKSLNKTEAPSRTEKMVRQEARHRLSDIPAASRLIEETRRTNSLPLNGRAPAGVGQLPKSQGDKFFQRLSNLRRSFNTTDYRRSGGKIRPHINRRDTPFFEGIPPEESQRNARGLQKTPRGVSWLVVPPFLPLYRPPARKYPGCAPTPASEGARLKRSLSFSDAQVIAQSVADSEPKLIHELYPGFPFSDPIYTVIDRAKTVRQNIVENPAVKDLASQVNGEAKEKAALSKEDLNSSNSSTVVNIQNEDPGTGESLQRLTPGAGFAPELPFVSC